MPTLPNILPTTNVATFSHNEAAGFSGSSVNHGEAFDQMMVRALAPTKPKNDSPPQTILPLQTKAQLAAADSPQLVNPAAATTVAAGAPDFLPAPDQVKTTSAKNSADHSKVVSHHAAGDPALTVQRDDKIVTAPLPLEIIVVPPSLPVEINPTTATKGKVVTTTSSSGKNVSPTAGQIPNQVGSTAKNIGATGTPTLSLPMAAASSKVVSGNVAENMADSIVKFSPPQAPVPALPAVKNIADVSAKVSTPDAAPNQPVASQPASNLANTSGTSRFSIGQTPVPPAPAAVSPESEAVADAMAQTVPTSPPTSTVATTKNIPATATIVSRLNLVPTQTVANPANPAQIETETTDTTVSSPMADITATAITASVVAMATETLPGSVTIPVVSTPPTITNPPPGKTASKVSANNAEKTTVAGPVATGVKTTTATGVTATSSTTTDSKMATTTLPTSTAAQANNAETTGADTDDSKTGKPAIKAMDEKSADSFLQRTLFSQVTQPVAGAKITEPTQVIDDGTSVAKQDGLVGDDGKPNKTEGLTGKILPGSGAPIIRGNDLPVRIEQFAATTATIAATQDSPNTATAAVERAGNTAVDDLNLQTMERTHELVALHAMRLNETGSGALQLVIKPSAGTQLSLELRQRENGVEAQVTVQQGDFKHLNQHWPELQQRLEQRGIKLASLAGDGISNQNNSSGGGRFEQKQNQSVEAVAGYAPGGPGAGTFTPVKPRVTTHQGWETWA